MLGTQVSLFDVRNPRSADAASTRSPSARAGRRRSRTTTRSSGGRRTRLAVLPVQAYDDRPFVGALGLRVRRSDGITEAGRVSHPAATGAEPVGSPGHRFGAPW